MLSVLRSDPGMTRRFNRKMKMVNKIKTPIRTENWPMSEEEILSDKDNSYCCLSLWCCMTWVRPSASRDLGTTSSLESADRMLLYEGPVEFKKGRERQQRYLILYSDVLLVGKIKYNKFKMKYKIKLRNLWMNNCIRDARENIDVTKSLIIGWPMINYVAMFSSADERDVWFSLLERFIALDKENDFPATIPLHVDFLEPETGHRVPIVNLLVKTGQNAKDVIDLALTALGIHGSTSEYQLWVSSGKDLAPYPLIGHESPYCIQMSHIRAGIQSRGLKDAPTINIQEYVYTELVSQEMRCQFTLRLRNQDIPVPLNDAARTQKKKRLIHFNFWHSHTTVESQSQASCMGTLFGHSLNVICRNNYLPAPVEDMLVILYEQGPLTEGIFHTSASRKQCRELREQLNSHDGIRLECKSAVLVATVFKEFLRSIPESVFSCHLYEEWVGVLDEETKEERIWKAQVLLYQLPRANVLLLRYLFSVLYCIEQNSGINKMSAFKLSVSIASSLLWPPQSRKGRNGVKRKVSQLIEFLIKHACEVFGEEIFDIFGEVSGICSGKENIPDSQLDSSYDSLDDEYEDHHYMDTPSCNVLKIPVQSTNLTTRVPFKDEPNLAEKNENEFSSGRRDHMGCRESNDGQHLQGECPTVKTMALYKSTSLSTAKFVLIFLIFTLLILACVILL